MRLHRWWVTLVVGVVFGLGLSGIDRDSLWYDEAWSVYAISPPAPTTYEPPRGLRAQVTTPLYAARDDLLTTLSIVADDVHPPLYFLLLDGWVWLVGDSVLVLRYLSLLIALIGVAVIYILGRCLFTPTAGLIAGAVYGTGMLFGYYAQEVRMYTLLMTLAAAATLAYTRLIENPNWRRGLFYAVLVALGMYTHYTAAFVPMAHGLHLLIMRRDRWLAWLIASMGAALLYVPWLPTLYTQIVTHPNGPLATPEPSNWTTISTLIGYYTGRAGIVYAVLILLLILVAVQMKTLRSPLVLVGLWLVVVPGGVLLVNAVALPVYNPRYTLAAVPALALLAGGGLVSLSRNRIGGYLMPIIVLGLIVDGLTVYDGNWGAKPPYREAINEAAESRSPLEPALTQIVTYDPFHYHAAQSALLNGTRLDLSWRDHGVDEIREIVGRFADTESVWLMMPSNHPKTWFTVAALVGQGRILSYRDGVQNMLIYRFTYPSDLGRLELPLTLTYGTLDREPIATYTGMLGEDILALPGEDVCIAPPLTWNSAGTHLSLSLVRGYNNVLDQWNGPPNIESMCVTLPEDAIGDYYLYLTLFHPATGQPYPVWNDQVWWGNWIVTHRVSVTPQGYTE